MAAVMTGAADLRVGTKLGAGLPRVAGTTRSVRSASMPSVTPASSVRLSPM